MNTNIKTKTLRIIQFALREFGHQDGKAAVFILELLEREHIRHEQRWLKSPTGQAWLNTSPKST
jgi:hypothetical protein